MKWNQRLRILSSTIVLVCATSATAQQTGKYGAAPPPGVQPAPVLVAEFKGVKLERKEDVSLCIMGVPSTGKSLIRGSVSMKVYQQGPLKIFDLAVEGNITSQSVSTQAVVQVYSHGVARFHGRRRLVYDGKVLSGKPSEVHVHQRSYVDSIGSNRHGVLGAAASSLARPIVNLRLPESERIVANFIRGRVSKAFDQESEAAIKTLNIIGDLTNPPPTPPSLKDGER